MGFVSITEIFDLVVPDVPAVFGAGEFGGEGSDEGKCGDVGAFRFRFCFDGVSGIIIIGSESFKREFSFNRDISKGFGSVSISLKSEVVNSSIRYGFAAFIE